MIWKRDPSILISAAYSKSCLGQMLLCMPLPVNSAPYPEWDGKWVVAFELWGEEEEGLVMLVGAVVWVHAAPLVQLFDGLRNALCGYH